MDPLIGTVAALAATVVGAIVILVWRASSTVTAFRQLTHDFSATTRTNREDHAELHKRIDAEHEQRARNMEILRGELDKIQRALRIRPQD
jgi:hypothetical protein